MEYALLGFVVTLATLGVVECAYKEGVFSC